MLSTIVQELLGLPGGLAIVMFGSSLQPVCSNWDFVGFSSHEYQSSERPGPV